MRTMAESKEVSPILSVGPALAAITYPCALWLFYVSVRLFHSANHFADCAITLPSAALSLSLAYAVPAFGLFAAYSIGRRDQRSPYAQRALLLAHLAVASRPMFTAIGVICVLIDTPNADYIVWLLLWVSLAIFGACSGRCTVPSVRSPEEPGRVRMAHGISAFLILSVFLAGHMINHMIAIWSLASDIEVMDALRRIYRADWLEPGLVGFFVFQIVSGLILLESRMTRKTDFFGVLQTTCGIYLAAFLISHMAAIFALARFALNVNTNDAWAAGLPAGLVANLWNTRLIPHYSLAAFLLIAHVGCGLRGILLAHGRSLASANRITIGITGVGAVVATVIIVAMLGLHVATA